MKKVILTIWKGGSKNPDFSDLSNSMKSTNQRPITCQTSSKRKIKTIRIGKDTRTSLLRRSFVWITGTASQKTAKEYLRIPLTGNYKFQEVTRKFISHSRKPTTWPTSSLSYKEHTWASTLVVMSVRCKLLNPWTLFSWKAWVRNLICNNVTLASTKDSWAHRARRKLKII